MRTESINIYTFDELSDKAKEKAIQWYRGSGLDYEWWCYVYEDAKTIASLMGIKIDQIYFSGFWSQGDGACFTGKFGPMPGTGKDVKDYAPKDETLHNIADKIYQLQKQYDFGIMGEVCRNDYYSHSGTMYLEDVNISGEYLVEYDVIERKYVEILRTFADWIYKQLENEYNYLTSDEHIVESIQINEYEFLEDGSIY